MTYFEKKSTKDFQNSKRFWQFYKSFIKLCSDKSGNEVSNQIMNNDIPVAESDKIATCFGKFFTTIESLSNKDECVRFIE